MLAGNKQELLGHSVGTTHVSPLRTSPSGQKQPIIVTSYESDVLPREISYVPLTHCSVQNLGKSKRLSQVLGQLLPQLVNTVSPGHPHTSRSGQANEREQ